MNRIKSYRNTGWSLIIFGIIMNLISICQPYKFRRFINDPQREFMPALYGSLMLFAINIFIWPGLILHWRADRNETPDKKSKWGKFIKAYLIFTIVILLFTAYLVILPNLSK